MKKLFAGLAIISIGVLAILPAQASNKTYQIKFKKNATFATYKGTIKGYDTNDYVFYAKKGQCIYPKTTGDIVSFLTGSGMVQLVSIDKYSTDLDSNGGYTLPYTGSYKISVGQMRAMARRDRAVNYTLMLSIR